MDQTATPPRDQRPRRWWSGRATVGEIMDAAGPAAAPSWDRPPVVRGVLGGSMQRRRQALPTPPTRERPPDLQATAEGVQLYGPRTAVPAPYQLAGPAARVPADVVGVRLAYSPLQGRQARVTGIRVQTLNAAAVVYEVQLVRGGVTLPLYVPAAGATLGVEVPIVLQPGDTLQVATTTPSAAGGELAIAMAIEEWT